MYLYVCILYIYICGPIGDVKIRRLTSTNEPFFLVPSIINYIPIFNGLIPTNVAPPSYKPMNYSYIGIINQIELLKL